MINIGILIQDTSNTGGTGKVAINLAEELSKYYNVHLINLFNENNQERNIIKKYKYHTLNREYISITKNIGTLSKRLKKIFVQNNINVVLSIDAATAMLSIISGRKIGVKTIFCEHFSIDNKIIDKRYKISRYLASKYSDKIITLTNRDRETFIKKIKVSQDKILTIPNWIEDVYKEKLQYHGNSKKIITVGRLDAVKGHNLLIEVAKKLKEKHEDWKWEIYGDGPRQQEIEESIKENNLQDFVILKGNVQNITEKYKEAAMFVLTSYYEALPLVLLEAQQAKLPIVSFDCPTGPAEIIEENKNGYLIPVYDVNIMAEKINELIEDEEKRKEFSRNAQINMWKFDKENIIKKWIKVIEEI